jgi:hypothetical protein
MRKHHLPLLAALALLAPACKDNDKSGSSTATYACDKCSKTKEAPASQAPS